MQGEDYFRDTGCEAVAGQPGCYRGELSNDWMLAVAPQGGIVAALAGRAMTAEIDHPDQRLRTLTAMFAQPVRPGPVEIDVTVLRRGRSISQATATVRNVGAEAGLTAVAAFGATRPGFEFTDVSYPVADPPEDCPSFRDPWPDDVDLPAPSGDPFPFWTRVEGRPASGHAPWETWTPTTSEHLTWQRFDDPPVGPDGRLDPLALVVLVDMMPGAVSERMGEWSEWFGPSVDLTVHLFDTPGPGWLLLRNRARHAGDGYASVEMEAWDPETRSLVAYATQQMFFAFNGEPPPPERRRPVDQRRA
ncbi:MAG TPA: thioesterase family protein [Acidimicrobiales bacterium]|nr:thioesterase family protein [Acidimicrobiales bacterium]